MENKFNFRFIWAVFMVLAYVGVSYLVLFTPVLIRYNAETNTSANDQNLVIRIILGIVLFVYGIFRGYRLWKISK